MPDNLIYIAIGAVSHDYEDILGVFYTNNEALQRVRDIDGSAYPYDRYWIHTWRLGAAELTAIQNVSRINRTTDV